MTQLQMSLSDVAALAGVERPVPSVWRRRSADTDLPFPSPVATVAGEDRFDVDEVVEWLEATARGNNATVREDAAVFALPAGLNPREDQLLIEALAALLCLRVVTGEDLGDLSVESVEQLLQVADPDDSYLGREVRAAGDQLAMLARLADRRADAAYSSVAAFDQLSTQKYRSLTAPSMRTSVAPPAHLLVNRLAEALGRECGAPASTYVEPTGSGNDLVVTTVLADRGESPNIVTPEVDTAAARAFRRRLRVHGIVRTDRPDTLEDLGPAVAVVHLPGPEALDAGAMLDLVDDLALGITDEQRALVIGPAAVLIDRLRDRALEGRRAQILRVGRVRAVVRLPAGLVTRRSREHLALWVLGPDHSSHDVEDRRVATVDLTDDELTELVVDQLVDDVVAAMGSPSLARAHHYSRARLVRTATLLVSSGRLVAAPARLPSTQSASAYAVTIQRLRDDGRGGPDALGGLTVVTDGDTSPMAATTLGAAVDARALRSIGGNSSGFSLVANGSVPVIGVPELEGRSRFGSRRVDRLAFLGGWDSSRLTEPGDVVWCSSPRPIAMVDVDGGSAVERPARILRVDPVRGEGLSPHVLAHDISGMPARSRDWRSWPARRIAAAVVPAVGGVSAALAAERTALTARLAELDTLAAAVIDGLTSGALSLAHPAPAVAGTTTHDQEDT
jgi:hypothetical protein